MPDHTPLTPAVFEILLSMVDGEKHGYAILLDVEHRTGGRLTLHAGTLYRALGRLVEGGLLVETDGPEVPEDERRRYYRITPRGADVARAEAERLELRAREARAVLDRAAG
jgi:DNA-binding PadR family transcriptional regulator